VAKLPCQRKRYVVVIDPGHGGTSYKDNIGTSSSWNNSIGVVSNTLEKTMTHRFAEILAEMLAADAARYTEFTLEVHRTKTDENTNLSGPDRAAVAKDNHADFFVILHFNSIHEESLAQRSGEQTAFLDVTPAIEGLTRDKPDGFKRRLFSRANMQRGPQVVKRSDMPKDHALVTSEAFAKQVAEGVLAQVKRLDATASLKRQPDITMGVATLSPSYLGTNDAASRGMVCLYLEGDYINVESGDRAWNPAGYKAKIDPIRKLSAEKVAEKAVADKAAADKAAADKAVADKAVADKAAADKAAADKQAEKQQTPTSRALKPAGEKAAGAALNAAQAVAGAAGAAAGTALGRALTGPGKTDNDKPPPVEKYLEPDAMARAASRAIVDAIFGNIPEALPAKTAQSKVGSTVEGNGAALGASAGATGGTSPKPAGSGAAVGAAAGAAGAATRKPGE
jgi:N-acetylmuramoyl-L-alanine amidase